MTGLASFDPFFGFFFRSFCVKHFPGCHSISVLQGSKQNLTYTVNRNMKINPKKLNDIAYPSDFSNIGSSSSIM
jgi:hypothetical protein